MYRAPLLCFQLQALKVEAFAYRLHYYLMPVLKYPWRAPDRTTALKQISHSSLMKFEGL